MLSAVTRIAAALLVACSLATVVEAGCGCAKPPPPLAAVRPGFVPVGGNVALFDAALVEGTDYTVRFGEAPGVAVETTAVLRRDFADAVEKPQLVVAVPDVALGPTTITVEHAGSTVFTVPSSDFTVLQPPLALPESDVETIATCYRAAVGADGTVYFPVDVSDVDGRTFFSGALRGYRLRFDADDIVIYNSQGVLMQLLDGGAGGIYTIVDDEDALATPPLPQQTTSIDGNSTVVDFDPDAVADIGVFTSVVGSKTGFRSHAGTGNPASKSIEFDASKNTTELVMLPNFVGRLYEPGARVHVTADVQFRDANSEVTLTLGVLAGGGASGMLQVQGNHLDKVTFAFFSSIAGEAPSQVGLSVSAALTTNWQRIAVDFEYDGTDIVASGEIFDIGADGTASPTPVAQIQTTFSNPALEANAVVVGAFGVDSATNQNPDDTRVDNFGMTRTPAPGIAGTGGDASGDGVDQQVKSFRLTYDRHQFNAYHMQHVTDSDLYADIADHEWHADGTRHIDHDHLIIAIKGTLNGEPPAPGETPLFDFRTVTTSGDALAAPTTTRIVRGACPCGPTPADDCRTATKSTLDIRDRTPDARDTLSWKWARGDASDWESFGDPLSKNGAALCLYDESGSEPERLLRSAARAAGVCRRGRSEKPCWRGVGKPAGTRGYLYRDPGRSSDGLEAIMLRPGPAGKAKLAVKARGDHLGLPPLPLGVPLRVQLHMANGQCWEATYSSSGVKKNGETTFKATGDP